MPRGLLAQTLGALFVTAPAYHFLGGIRAAPASAPSAKGGDRRRFPLSDERADGLRGIVRPWRPRRGNPGPSTSRSPNGPAAPSTSRRRRRQPFPSVTRRRRISNAAAAKGSSSATTSRGSTIRRGARGAGRVTQGLGSYRSAQSPSAILVASFCTKSSVKAFSIASATNALTRT